MATAPECITAADNFAWTVPTVSDANYDKDGNRQVQGLQICSEAQLIQADIQQCPSYSHAGFQKTILLSLHFSIKLTVEQDNTFASAHMGSICHAVMLVLRT